MMQINMIEGTLTPGGEEQVAYLVFCKYASSVPRSEWERCVVLQELFLSWLYRIENKGMSYIFYLSTLVPDCHIPDWATTTAWNIPIPAPLQSQYETEWNCGTKPTLTSLDCSCEVSVQ